MSLVTTGAKGAGRFHGWGRAGGGREMRAKGVRNASFEKVCLRQTFPEPD